MNTVAFQRACDQIIDIDYTRNSIGVLKEKTVHAVLKYYLEPHAENHEIKIGNYIADIVGEQGIIEIQTAGFDKLRKKLECFLDVSQVSIVYPIAQTKWLCWIDPVTGEVSKRRKSPKRGNVYDAAWELNKIGTYLNHMNLKIHIVFLELCEYRYLNGWSTDRKKGSVRCDRIPLALCDELILEHLKDYRSFLPANLPALFTVKDFAKETSLTTKRASTTLLLLYKLGIVKRCGKRGNAFVYQR